MDVTARKNIGLLLCLSEFGPQLRNIILQNLNDSQIDALSSVALNIIFDKLTLNDATSESMAKYSTLMLLLADKSKGRGVKKSQLIKHPKFVSLLTKGIRRQLIQQLH